MTLKAEGVEAEATHALSPSVIERAIRVIDAVHEAGGQLSLTGLVAQTGLPKTTVHRLASELVRLGVVERSQGDYRLGVRAFQWGCTAPFIGVLRNVALPVMEELTRVGQVVVRLSVLDGDYVVFVTTLGNHWLPLEDGLQHTTTLNDPRTRLPAHATASGKVMLAYRTDPLQGQPRLPALTSATITDPGRLRRQLATVREKGFGLDIGEARCGVVAAAAPLWYRADVVGALSIASGNATLEPSSLALAVEKGAQRVRSLLSHRAAF